MLSRRHLLSALGTGLVGSGCLDGSGGSPAPASPETASPTPSPEPSPTGDWVQRAENEPDPGHAVFAENDHDVAHVIAVTVVRESTGETVHQGSTSLPPGASETVYDTARANPDGVESFSVEGTLDGDRTRTSHIRTNSCFGDVSFIVTEDGDFGSGYSIC